MATRAFDPYAIYRSRPFLRSLSRREDEYGAPERDEREGAPIGGEVSDWIDPTTYDENPRRNKTAGAGYGEVVKFNEKPPTQPSEEIKTRARLGEESETDRDIIRNWREYWARKGAWEEDMLAQGLNPDMPISQRNMRNQYGTSAANIDIAGKRVWDTTAGERDPKTGKPSGGWVPMSEGEYSDIMKYRNWRETPDAYRRAQAYGGYETGDYAAYARQKEVENRVRRGDLAKDPKSGYYYNPGMSGPDPKNWEWFDQYGRPASMPAGYVNPNTPTTPTSTGGMDPNNYYLNRPRPGNENVFFPTRQQPKPLISTGPWGGYNPIGGGGGGGSSYTRPISLGTPSLIPQTGQTTQVQPRQDYVGITPRPQRRRLVGPYI